MKKENALAQFVSCPVECKNKMSQLLGQDNVNDDEALCVKYSEDKTADLQCIPDVVVKPDSDKHISQIMKWVNQYMVPVTVRARGTGLSGAALPICGGICLSMEKFDRVLEIDSQNLQAIVEPYVLNYNLQKKARESNLFYPPDPASYRMCSLGGNFSHNAGGPKAVKYGVTRNYVLALELVLPNGQIITAGSRALKNSTGYSIKDLVIGSEGTLAIITKAILRLIPLPLYDIDVCYLYKREKCGGSGSQNFDGGIDSKWT